MQAALSRATRLTTPCRGDGVTVWHRWGSGPPVVLLHGGSGAWNHWIRNVDALAASHTVFAADLPGCGDSSLPPGTYDADSVFEHVADGMMELGSGKPMPLVGFSFGSLVSGLIAARRPEAVSRLVLVAPPALGLKHPELGLVSLGRPMPPDEYEASVRLNLERLMLADPAAVDDLAMALHAANFTRDRLRMRRLARSRIMLELKLQWRCPVHLIWGRDDTLAHAGEAALRSALDGCDLRSMTGIENAGHWVQYERADAFDRALAACLA